MPTYQYSCTECGHFFEQVQTFTEDSLTVCPECDGRLRKVFNAVGVVFKGSGFYRTDSRAKTTASDTAATTSSSPKAGESGGSSDTGSGSGSKATTPTSTGSGSSGSSTAGAGAA